MHRIEALLALALEERTVMLVNLGYISIYIFVIFPRSARMKFELSLKRDYYYDVEIRRRAQRSGNGKVKAVNDIYFVKFFLPTMCLFILPCHAYSHKLE